MTHSHLKVTRANIAQFSRSTVLGNAANKATWLFLHTDRLFTLRATTRSQRCTLTYNHRTRITKKLCAHVRIEYTAIHSASVAAPPNLTDNTHTMPEQCKDLLNSDVHRTAVAVAWAACFWRGLV